MKTRWNSIPDGRGVRREYCTIAEACKASGIAAGDLAPPGSRVGFGQAVAIGLGFGAFWTVWMSVFFWIFFRIRGVPFGPGGVARVALGGVACAAVLWGCWYRRAWRSGADAARQMLAHGLCPACAHGIGALPPAGDGCVVCPECGAAWAVRPGDGTAKAS